ncbi:hypothetical protein RND81_07G061400 [Saponaria officinalis]|uniref:Uncharacterized protein n=1 Tax=Saponaria officinalis TaxID=3572 RepID=A0AAW1JNL0_SAPOF
MAPDISSKSKGFKYYNMWALDENFLKIVEDLWCGCAGTPMFQLTQRLKAVKRGLKQLNRERFSNVETRFSIASQSLEEAQRKLHERPGDSGLSSVEKSLAAEVAVLLKARNMFLVQKEKCKWLAEGDDNTAFFHASIKKRRQCNKVFQICDMKGTLWTDPTDIKCNSPNLVK